MGTDFLDHDRGSCDQFSYNRCQVNHPEDQANVQNVILGKPDAFRPELWGDPQFIVDPIGGHGKKKQYPGPDQRLVQWAVGLIISPAIEDT